MKCRIRMYLVASAVLMWAIAQADAPPRPLVVELFTAQGCSSCPPADEYLGQLSQRPEVLALAFHVDYWDSGGWRDRFELHQSVERQSVYVRNFHRASAYTPQFVIDGRTDDIKANTIAQVMQGSRDAVPVALAVREGQVVVEIGDRQGKPAGDVLLVTFLRHAISNVGRGENAGRSLEEFNIVRSIRTLGTWKGAAENYKVGVSSLPADATNVAVLVQSRGTGPIVGAASQSLH